MSSARHRARGDGRDAGDGDGRDAGDGGGRGGRKRGSFFRELPVLVVVALALALLIKAFIVQAYSIPSGSMQHTLEKGDRVLVNKLAYDFHDIHRGDVIVFSGAGSWGPPVSEPDNAFETVKRAVGGAFGANPTGETDFIKRVIGLPGDHVACCDARGRVTVDGVPLNGDPYIYGNNVPSESEFEVTVPEGELWVMGDHRGISADSRAHRGDPGGGAIPIDKVVGRAFAIVWPPSQISLLSPPRTFSQPALE